MATAEIVVGILAFLGGGTAKALIDWAGKAQLKKLEIAKEAAAHETAQMEAEAMAKQATEAFAREAWKHEADGHRDCLDRLRIVESALANESRRGDLCEANYKSLKEASEKQTALFEAQIADMREAMLATFVGDVGRARGILSTPPGGIPVAKTEKDD